MPADNVLGFGQVQPDPEPACAQNSRCSTSLADVSELPELDDCAVAADPASIASSQALRPRTVEEKEG